MLDSNIAEWYHLGHAPTIVVLKDRDILCFRSDFVYGDIDLIENDIYYCTEDASESNIVIRYHTDFQETFSSDGKFMLLMSRLVNQEIVNGTTIVCYLSQDESVMVPFFEVHQPRITYDQTSNTLTMWFWTYFKTKDDSGTEVWNPSDGYVAEQVYSQYNVDVKNWEEEVPEGLKRMLCYTTGSLQRFMVFGGGYPGSGHSDPSLDFVPIFSFPAFVFPEADWPDIPPYPESGGSINYQRNGSQELKEGMPLVPYFKGSDSGYSANGDLLLTNPSEATDNIYDGFPYFYVHGSYITPTTTPKTGYAYYPTGRFMALVDAAANGASIKVGDSLGCISQESGIKAFVRGVFGARCMSIIGSYTDPDTFITYTKVWAVRDHMTPLVMAMSDAQPDRQQVVQMIPYNQTLGSPPTGKNFTVMAAPDPDAPKNGDITALTNDLNANLTTVRTTTTSNYPLPATITAINTDGTLTCTENGNPITVQMPPLLNNTLASRIVSAGLITYSYSSAIRRTATLNGNPEDERIVPELKVGELIYVSKLSDDSYIDLNVSAHIWVKV